MRIVVIGILVVATAKLAIGVSDSSAHQEKQKKETVVGNDICVDYASNEAKADAKYQDKIVRLTPGTHLARLIVMKVTKEGKDYVLVVRGYGQDNRQRCYVHCYGITKEELANAPIGKIEGVTVQQPSCTIEGEFLSFKIVGGNNVVTLKNCTLSTR